MFVRRLLLILLAAATIGCAINLVSGSDGLFAALDMKHRHEELVRDVEALEEHTVTLSREIRWLRSDAAYQESAIRAETGFVRPDEIVYIFPDMEQTQVSAATQGGQTVRSASHAPQAHAQPLPAGSAPAEARP